MDKIMMNAPCKGCERAGCGSYHDQCEKYQNYKRTVDAYKKSQIGQSIYKSYVEKAVRRMKGEKV